MKPRFRIVQTADDGYAVQVKHRTWIDLFWCFADGYNGAKTIQEAESYVRQLRYAYDKWRVVHVVKEME
jgi:hypothetical protein